MLCPPCEGNYHLAERGPIVGDITAFYRAFHLEFLTKEGPPDSIKMESAFLCYLALKEAYALENRLLQEAEVTYDAQKKFLSDHLGRWGPLFASALKRSTTLSYYRTVGALLEKWLEMENQYLDIQPAALPIALPSLKERELRCET